MAAIPDHEQRIAAALCGAAAARAYGDPVVASDPVDDMFAVAEAIAAGSGTNVEALRQPHLSRGSGTALLLRVLPFGLATPLDRPRLRRQAYRAAAAAGADEGTALVCVAAALVAADLLRFDPASTATRVRQSLLEDAPMALLNRLTIRDAGAGLAAEETDPGAALQVALSVQEWTERGGVAAALARLGDGGRGDLANLAAALAGAACAGCDVPVDPGVAERAGRVASALASLGAQAVLQ
ncbi:MAG: hypothetical protein ACRENL_12580 [Candidatus Dormibacteria bacterium]